jgi:membrane peptidoglycan carboxypeptidase
MVMVNKPDSSLGSAAKSQLPDDGRPAGARLARGCGRLVILSVQLGLIGLLLAVIAFLGVYLYLSSELGSAIDQVVLYQGQGPGGTPRFYDRYGTLLFELKTAEKRRWLDYAEIPQNVIDATVAVEDDTFWINLGFDPEAILAAFIRNYRNQEGRPVGASTITQQLVRHIAFTYEERVTTSYERKVREVFLAFILTRQRSKPDILQMYLNEIYYGNLAYGIEAAAQTYFGIPAADLTLGQAAFLAGLPQAPSDLDPYTNFAAAKERQEFILDLMVDEGYIDTVTARVATAEALTLAPLISAELDPATDVLKAPHFVLYVQHLLEQRYGPDALTRGGWQITTSLDLALQEFSEQVVREWITVREADHDVNNASVVVLKPGTGEILTMVGSLDYFDTSISGLVNVALQPRQPGSSIKPITYAAAMERGWTTGDVIWDVPIELELGQGRTMVPVNYDNRYHGPLLLRDALANSYNIPPVQLIRDIGVPAFISTARKMGVESLTEPPGYYGLALTLGGGEVPLLEMTHAFATLANMGQRPRLTGVLQIKDSRGNLVYDLQREKIPASNALDPRIAYVISDILDDDAARAPAFGRNSDLALPFPAAVKTGTTNDFRDNWTLGYTPGVVVGVWVGNTDGHPMRNSSGVRGAAPIWRIVMEYIHDSPAMVATLLVDGRQPPVEFPRPGGLEERTVCLPRGTGGTSCTASRQDLFLVGGPMHGIQRLGYVPDILSNPGAWTLAVSPISGEAAQLLLQPPLANGFQPAAPTLCVLNTARPPEGVTVRLFLPIPPFYPDEVRARLWAQQNGYFMAPPSVCPTAVARQSLGAGGGGDSRNDGQNAGQAAGDQGQSGGTAPSSSAWRITSPAPGQQISGLVPIMGTANFDPAAIQYYKLEIGSGVVPSSWTTFGSTHSNPVINGVLENLHADALAPGQYVIRLILVGHDGNYAAPYSVPITIVAP